MATLRSYSATVDKLGAKARWRFDEEAGASALDRVGSLNGSYQGTFAHGGPGPIGDGAVRFDGAGALTRVPTATGDGPIRLGFLGDSLVDGFGLSTADAFPAVLTAALEGEGSAIDPVVDGNNGQRSDQLIDDAQSLAAQGLDAVILVIGTNDSLQGRDPAAVKNDLRTIIQTFQDAGTEVLLTSTYGLWPDEIRSEPGYDTDDPANAEALAAEFEAIYPALRDELGVTLFGPFTQPVREDPASFNLIVNDQPDGVHPNAAGVAKIVESILPVAEGLLEGIEPGGENLFVIDDGSVEGWFVAADTEGVQGLIARDATGLNDGDFRIFLDGGRLSAVVESAGVATELRSSANAVEPGQAFHVVLAFGAAGVALFLNGVLVDASADPFSATGNDNPLLFGALPGASGEESFFHGVIDEVVIYDGVLDGDDVADLFAAGVAGSTIIGTEGDDRIIGAEDDETLRGKGGADQLLGKGGDDQLIGGAGRDSVHGGAGNDTINGGGGGDNLNGDAGNDLILGKAGADVVSGGADDDVIRGGGGADRLLGNGGNDIVIGGPGADLILGGGGLDQLFGGGGDDDIGGGSGNDRIEGGGGADLVRGGGGNDQLFGQSGNDELFGGAGDDLLVGGPGRDLLSGGAGADVFRIEALGDRLDKILDFAIGIGGDQLDLSGLVDGFVGGSDPNGFVRLVDNGVRTRVRVDSDGDGGGFTAVADLVGVGGLDLDQLMVDGNINLG